MRPGLVSRVVVPVALVVAVCWGWLKLQHRSLVDAAVPIHYGGDGWGVMAQFKAYQAGELWPFWPKEVGSLGAPFGASWTDYPAEDLIYFLGGIVARLTSVEASAALVPMIFAALCAVSFYAVARTMGYARAPAFACGILFALSPYAFYRGIQHLTLTAYGHIPLLLLGLYWASARDRAGLPRHAAWLAFAGAALGGLLNPYYLAIYLVLLAVVAAGAMSSRRRVNWVAAVQLMAVAIAAFALQALDSLWTHFTQGANPDAVQRSLADLDRHGLRLPDLAFPIFHRFEWWQSLGQAYQGAAPGSFGRGEAGWAYFGIVSVVGLAWLLASGTLRLAARQPERTSPWLWMALGTIAFGVVGGINYILGSLGFVMLRATNRYSIVLMALALLWLCACMTPLRPGWRWIASALVLAIGLADQTPPAQIVPMAQDIRDAISRDRRFAVTLEAAVPERSMVFQLPVKAFPEEGPTHHVQDYEHFRPYFFARTLRFSYASMKGRGATDWQHRVAALPANDMAAQLARYGFAAVYVNLHGYADKGSALRSQLEAVLGKPIAESYEQLAFRLPRHDGPVEFPPLEPVIRYRGFWGEETDGRIRWAWARQRSPSVHVTAPAAVRDDHSPPDRTITFGVDAGFGGSVQVLVDGQEIAVVTDHREFAIPFPKTRRRSSIELRSADPPREPGNGDPRRLGMRLIHFRVTESPRPAST